MTDSGSRWQCVYNLPAVKPPVRKLRFFNLDLHISVIADLKYIFEYLGHEVVDWSISGHTWVFGRKRDPVEVVNQGTWLGLNQKMCDDFHSRYREVLDGFDAFIVTYNASFALLYEKTGKPIIVDNPTRYENPFTTSPEKWRWLNDYLARGVDSGRITIVSNNRGDEYYLRHFTGIASQVIPSLCLYTKAQYRGRRDAFILVSRIQPALLHRRTQRVVNWVTAIMPRMADRLFVYFQGKRQPLIRSRFLNQLLLNKTDALKDGFSWQSFYDFKGIIHIPYQVSTMSIFEQYSANVPLFFPSKKFLFELHTQFPDKVLSELSFYQVNRLDTSGLAPDDPNNLANDEIVKRWIDLADYYDELNMPYVQYFDSFEHLESLLREVDCREISEKMRAFNQQRIDRVFRDWEKILTQVASFTSPF
jgi:hypothetical protein